MKAFPRRFWELVDLVQKGELSARDADELEALLRDEPTARAMLADLLNLEAELHWRVSALERGRQAHAARAARGRAPGPATPASFFRGQTLWRTLNRPVLFSLLFASVVIVSLLLSSAQVPAPQFGQDRSNLGAAAAPVGYLVGLSQAEWADGVSRNVGQAVLQQTLRLAAGSAKIQLANGALLKIDGPTTLRLETADSCYLDTGYLMARVPRAATGFTVETAAAKIVDLGTQFEVRVGDGQTDVQVLQGAIELRPPATTPTAFTVARIGTQQAMRVSQGSLQPLEFHAEALARRHRVEMALGASEPALHPSSEYAALVMAGEPLAYWRFERLLGDRVPNEVGNGYPLTAVGSPRLQGSNQNRFARLSAQHDAYFVCEQPMPGLTESDYSLELWVRPQPVEMQDQQFILSAMVPYSTDPRSGFSMTALLALQPAQSAFRWRYLHRQPPGVEGGTNLFAAHAGQQTWQHLVAARSGAAVALYVNGRLAGEALITGQGQADPLIVLGRGGTRQFMGGARGRFTGDLDEVALYLRALKPEDVRRHYEAMRLVAPTDHAPVRSETSR